MSYRIADCLKRPSFQGANVLCAARSLNRQVFRISSDTGSYEPGTLLVVHPSGKNIASLLEAHPEAAGFIVPKSASPDCKDSRIPVIAVNDCDAVLAEKQSFVYGPSLSEETYQLLKESGARKTEDLLEVLKQETGTDLYLVNPKDNTLWLGTSNLSASSLKTVLKRHQNLNLPVILIEGEERLLLSSRKTPDAYALCSSANALEAVSSLYKKSNQTGAVVRLFREKEPGLVRMLVKEAGLKMGNHMDVWVLKGEQHANIRAWIRPVREFCACFSNVYFLEQIGNDLILFLEPAETSRAKRNHAESLAELILRSRMPFTLITGTDIMEDAEYLKRILHLLDEVWEACVSAYPQALYYTMNDLMFVKSCCSMKGSEKTYYQGIVDKLVRESGDHELEETLGVYFLDQAMSVTETASFLFVHRNTIKYRLQRVEDILGIDIGNVTDIAELVKALILGRVSKPDENANM